MASEQAPVSRRIAMRWWERCAVAFFGLSIVGMGDGLARPWSLLAAIAGWLIVAAAIGVVELVLALRYRWWRHAAAGDVTR